MQQQRLFRRAGMRIDQKMFKTATKMLGLFIMTAGCAQNSLQKKEIENQKQRMAAMERRILKLQKELSSLSEKTAVLQESLKAKAVQPRPMPQGDSLDFVEDVVENSIFSKQEDKSLEAPIVPKIKKPTSELTSHGDDLLYTKAVASYRHRMTSDLLRTVQLLEKGYAQSSWTDNAYYLLGRHYQELGKYKKAVRTYKKLVEKYPASNKSVSALYAQALAYKSLKMHGRAKRILRRVQKNYPGSRESYLAQTELKILEMERL